MNIPRFLPLTRSDAAILAITLSLATGLALIADSHFDRLVDAFGLPDKFAKSGSHWIDGSRSYGRPGERLMVAGAAWLSAFGSGLAVISFRPRREGSAKHRRRAGPGRIASGLTLMFSLTIGLLGMLDWACWVFVPGAQQASSGPHFLPYWNADVHLYLLPRICWATVFAWVVLALTGGPRRAEDWLERLGRCLGWAWFALLAVAALVFALAVG